MKFFKFFYSAITEIAEKNIKWHYTQSSFHSNYHGFHVSGKTQATPVLYVLKAIVTFLLDSK